MNHAEPQPTVHIVDDLHPEDEAMLQALYSRSAASVVDHLKKVRETKSGKFMETYYVGYGHASIGDCGTTTLFFENVSTLAAKAIQDWALYSGQETSTRYIDMAKQPIVDPVGTPASRAILERWMDFYTGSRVAVAAEVRSRHPIMAGEDATKYEGAVQARTFDILRGFLPAGICTQLSWHTNLRQAKEHLELLSAHPCDEIANLAFTAREELAARYGSSGFRHSVAHDRDRDRAEWTSEVGREPYLLGGRMPTRLDVDFYPHTVSAAATDRIRTILRRRPRGATPPRHADALGVFHARFPLDFGSFRDIQRHRPGITFMPLLTTKGGFETWYIEQLPVSLLNEAIKLVREQEREIDLLPCKQEHRQYYCALGHRVPCEVVYGLAQAIYVTELRTTKFVHPTLRKVMREFATEVGFAMNSQDLLYYPDDSPDDWDVRRGGQTITEKKA